MEENKRRAFTYKGFIIICAHCGEASATVEARQDGVDFQCRKCGNKLLMRPGEVMKVPVMKPKSTQKVSQGPKQFLEDQTKQFELDLKIEDLQSRDVPMDDWANEVLDEFYKRQGLTEDD